MPACDDTVNSLSIGTADKNATGTDPVKFELAVSLVKQ